MKKTETIVNSKEMIYSFFEKMEQNYTKRGECNGISTGFYDLDSISGGLHSSELTVIGGRPSMGKTAFAINLMNNIINQSIPVLYVSYEMNDKSLAYRLFSSYTEIDNIRLSHGFMRVEDWEKLAQAMDKMTGFAEQGLLHIIPSCNLNWKELFDEIRFFTNNHSNGVVIIDYFQLIKLIGDSDRIVELSTLAGAFKRLATELNFPIVLLSQVNRKNRESIDKRPYLEDLAECDALAQHADNVIFIYRRGYYQSEDDDMESEQITKGETEIIIAKQKNGIVGTIKLLFQDNITKFKNLIKTDEPYI